jgi:dihydropteroate synthase
VSGRAKFTEIVRASVVRRGAAIMGVCNVTPDSFSDGGLYFDFARARARIEELLAEGADLVDIGGESTRPGASPVPAQEQLARVLELVRWASQRTCVSIDTTRAEVARACLAAGAHAVNDVSLLAEPALATAAAEAGAALVLSHARAPQSAMAGAGGWPLSAYDDVVRDVLRDWERAAAVAVARGVPRDALVMDPGLGFTKASRHSLELLRRAGELVRGVGPEVPVLVGASNKSFLTLVDPDASATARLGASVMAAVHAVRSGARVVRVHAVRATRQALDLDVVLGTVPGHADRADRPLGEGGRA